jgi:hypothetical protein
MLARMRSEHVVIVVLGVALIASVADDLRLRRRHAPTTAAAFVELHAPPTTASDVPRATAVAAREVAPELAGTCPQQLSALTDRLAASEQKLAERLDAQERWEQGGAPVVDERELRAGLAHVFAGAPEGTSFELECRGSVCQIEVTERDGAPAFDWNAKIQEEFLHERAQGYMMTAGTPSYDMVTGEPLMTSRVFAEMNRAGTVAGHDVIDAALARFRDSGASRRCAALDGTPGFLNVRIDLEPAERRMVQSIGGDVAGAAVGRCLAEALAEALTATTVPANARAATRYVSITTPP